MAKWDGDIYNAPAYSVTDAARYLRIPVVTLRSWVKERPSITEKGAEKGQAVAPLIQRPNLELPHLSFTNLIEAHVLRIIRETHQVKLDKVRKALDYMSQQFNTSHPLATKKFQTDGIDLFVNQMDKLVNVSRSGQLAMRETLKHLLTRVEWDEKDIADRLFPFVQPEGDAAKALYIDPRISFGKPVIAGKGISTAAIVDLYESGEDIEDIADEFDCTPDQIKAAIQFESLSQAA